MVIGIFSKGMLRIPYLGLFLESTIVSGIFGRFNKPVDAIAGWGRKRTSVRAQHYAKQHALPYLAIEDGFIRSVGLGDQEPPLSIVLDDLGVYYDATTPSRLESMVVADRSEDQLRRALAVMEAWCAARISKYNHTREYGGELPLRYVLVADQTRGDASISFGLSDAASFQRMLSAALAEYPDCTVLLKVHPEVMAGRKRGHFDLAMLARNPRVRLLGEDVHPVSLIEHAEAVYTVTSQIGFEGLLWGKPVRTFGMPFYAGWGLTSDDLPAPNRRRPSSLLALIYASLVEYPRYIDPENGARCEVERVIEWMGMQRQMRTRFPATVYATGFSLYKRGIVRSFFQGSNVVFARSAAQLADNVAQVVWGRSVAAKQASTVIRLEDGFIRSVGLGADLVRPISWVMDQQGIYYDATCPSDLELILENTIFDEVLLARAHALRERMVVAGLTKYNVGEQTWLPPDQRSSAAGGKFKESSPSVILVPGQVESDASLAFGAPGIRCNLDLLRAVRAANPGAYVVYKPHPDVVAGLRRSGEGEHEARNWCDEIVIDVDMGTLLLSVDEVHTLTSLAGFEALLRGKKVVCYGQPFYAGWGLTRDIMPVERRKRSLALDELVAGVLILYPAYVSRTTGKFTTPERALDELLSWRESASSAKPWWGGIYRIAVRWILLWH